VLRAAGGTFFGGQGALGANGRQINNFPYNRSIGYAHAESALALRRMPALGMPDV
jgi:hypothetical protein